MLGAARVTAAPMGGPAERARSHQRLRSHERRRWRVGLRSPEHRRWRVLGVMAAAFFAGALALIPTAGASAHDYLVDSSPAAESVQSTALKDVSLTFDDLVLDLAGNGSSSLLQVTGPDGATEHFETGCASVSGRVVTAPVALGANGQYTVTWQIVSADGHTVSGSYTFNYQPPAGTKHAEGSDRSACGAAGSGTNAGSDADSGTATNAPSTRAPGSSGAATPNTPGSASADSGSLGIVITIAAVIIGLAVTGVLIILVTARRRPRRPDSDAEPDEEPDAEPDSDAEPSADPDAPKGDGPGPSPSDG